MSAALFQGPGLSASRSRTQVPGVGLALVAIHGRKQLHFTAHLGQKTKKFNLTRLGRAEAFRRAVKARATFEIERKTA
jgi:hypothetical protein